MASEASERAAAVRRRVRKAGITALLGSSLLSLAGCCLLLPEGVTVDAPLPGESEPNGVMEPGETVEVEPAWGRSDRCTVTSSAQGTASAFTGPPGAIYTIVDGSADYGTFTTHARCAATGNCYRLSVSALTRPARHWDASFLETLQPGFSKRYWTLHVGESFADVPPGHDRYRAIETMLHRGVDAGCSTGEYCPDQAITRAEGATFIARAYYRGDSSVPMESDTSSPITYRCGPGGLSFFQDVEPGDPSCKYVHALAREMDVACAADRFCPSTGVDRGTMARLVAAFGGHFDVPVTYGPDPATGRSYSCAEGGRVQFSDVGIGDPLCAPVHLLWAKGVVDGCSATEYCPSDPVTRSDAAAFVVGGFGLTLYDGEAAPTIPDDPCGSDETLCTREGRFAIHAVWRKPDGSHGAGHAVSLTDESGYFWFFEPGNVEVVAKTPAGCGVNGHEWFFAAGLTNLEVDLDVLDRATGEERTYVNPSGVLFRAITDTQAFASCGSGESVIADSEGSVAEGERDGLRPDSSSACVAGDSALCLGGRFRVDAEWRTGAGEATAAHAVALTSDAGYFWFFEPANVEVITKIVDACAIGRGRWFFGAGLTTAGVDLRVTDSLTGETRTYSNPDGQTFAPLADTSTFSVCSAPSSDSVFPTVERAR